LIIAAAGIGVVLLGTLVVATVSLLGLVPAQHRGPMGAADIGELVERYKKAHHDKDIEALRAIHLEMRQGIAWWPGVSSRMAGVAEYQFPTLFDFELVDVEVVNVIPRDGMVRLEYARKRQPVKENGFSPVQWSTVDADKPYKLLLIGRRPRDAAGPLMELDPCLGVDEVEGRLYLYAGNELTDVAEWIKTGNAPPVFRPQDHQAPVSAFRRPNDVPADWVRIVRPRK
jgi:hypothetical protein